MAETNFLRPLQEAIEKHMENHAKEVLANLAEKYKKEFELEMEKERKRIVPDIISGLKMTAYEDPCRHQIVVSIKI